jgi:hypothetical protein
MVSALLMFLALSHKTFNSMTSVVYQPLLAPLSRLDAREPVTRWTCITDINDFLIMIPFFFWLCRFEFSANNSSLRPGLD